MKVWTKVCLADRTKEVEQIGRSLTNYLYGYGPMLDIKKKYGISLDDYKEINQYMANRISGILMLYLASDYKRINDIVNKYNINNELISSVIPEIEGYINKSNDFTLGCLKQISFSNENLTLEETMLECYKDILFIFFSTR